MLLDEFGSHDVTDMLTKVQSKGTFWIMRPHSDETYGPTSQIFEMCADELDS